MHSFERLIEEHRHITTLTDALDRIAKDPPDADAAHAALRAIADDLGAHLATEDGDIYPQLMLSRDEGAASAARESIARFETLAGDWTIYEARWTRRAILAEWDAFVAATGDLLGRLNARVQTENELLYPLALRAAHIRLRE